MGIQKPSLDCSHTPHIPLYHLKYYCIESTSLGTRVQWHKGMRVQGSGCRDTKVQGVLGLKGVGV